MDPRLTGSNGYESRGFLVNAGSDSDKSLVEFAPATIQIQPGGS